MIIIRVNPQNPCHPRAIANDGTRITTDAADTRGLLYCDMD
jgi:hypothetical protein